MNLHLFGRWLKSNLALGSRSCAKEARLPACKSHRCAIEQLEGRLLLSLVVNVRVDSSSDDAEERAAGNVKLTSSDLEIVFDKNDQTVGMRFNGLGILQGSTIVNAYIQFQADETTSVDTSLTIEGQAVDNALTFTNSTGNISSRPRTSAAVSWSPAPWTNKGAAGPDQQTPDISAIVQEIVNRPGWASGNSMVVIIDGTGERTAEAYDGDQSGAPILHIEFVNGDPVPDPVVGVFAVQILDRVPVGDVQRQTLVKLFEAQNALVLGLAVRGLQRLRSSLRDLHVCVTRQVSGTQVLGLKHV